MLKIKATPPNLILCIFVAIETVIFITFNVLVAVLPDDPIYLKYSGILLCLAVSASLIYFYGKDAVILTCAFVFTAISDLFILVLDRYYEIGVTTFILTQSTYLFRLNESNLKNIWKSLAIRETIALIIIIIMALLSKINLLIVLVGIYFVMLTGNCVEAFIKKKFLFAVGLLLFIGCDVCVGLHNFGAVLNVRLPAGLIAFVQYAIWVFYLPSQVVIVCSVDKRGRQIVRERL